MAMMQQLGQLLQHACGLVNHSWAQFGLNELNVQLELFSMYETSTSTACIWWFAHVLNETWHYMANMVKSVLFTSLSGFRFIALQQPIIMLYFENCCISQNKSLDDVMKWFSYYNLWCHSFHGQCFTLT